MAAKETMRKSLLFGCLTTQGLEISSNKDSIGGRSSGTFKALSGLDV